MLWIFNGLHPIFIYISPSKCKCSSPSRNLVSCSLLTSCIYSFSCLSYGNVIYGISCLYSLSCPSYGNVIYGTSIFCLAMCTIVSIIDGSTLPLIILRPCFYALLFLLISFLNLRLFLPQLYYSS